MAGITNWCTVHHPVPTLASANSTRRVRDPSANNTTHCKRQLVTSRLSGSSPWCAPAQPRGPARAHTCKRGHMRACTVCALLFALFCLLLLLCAMFFTFYLFLLFVRCSLLVLNGDPSNHIGMSPQLRWADPPHPQAHTRARAQAQAHTHVQRHSCHAHASQQRPTHAWLTPHASRAFFPLAPMPGHAVPSPTTPRQVMAY